MISECLSTLNKPCIFPFSYKSVIHDKCTHVGSENGAAWCATEVRMLGINLHCNTNLVIQVDEDGKVVKNAWEDCQAGCPIEEQ